MLKLSHWRGKDSFTYAFNIFHKEIKLSCNESCVISQKQKSHAILRTIKLDTVAVTEFNIAVNLFVVRGVCSKSHQINP